MLRPSRPMMRPFRSSEGSSTTETVASTTVSEARRWIAMPMIRRAFCVACSFASSSMRRIRPAASSRASFSTRLDEVPPGVDGREARDLLEPLALLVDDDLDLRLLVLQLLLLVADGLFLPGVVLFPPLLLHQLAVEVFFFLLDSLFEGGDLLPTRLNGLVELDSGGQDLFLGLDVGLADLGFRLLAGVGQRPVRLGPDAEALLLDFLPGEEVADGGEDRGKDQPRHGRRREICHHPAPQNARGRQRTGRGYTMERKRLFRRGLNAVCTGPLLRTTRIPIVCSPIPSGCRRLAFRRPGRRPVFESGAPRGPSSPWGRPADVCPPGKDRP